MHINNEQTSHRPSTDPCETKTEILKTPLNRRVRAFSMNACDSIQTKSLMARMKHTFDYSSRGCKGNTRGDFIHESFNTLEQLLKNLPLNIALNIEISKSPPCVLSILIISKSQNTPCSQKRQMIEEWTCSSSKPISLPIPFFYVSQDISPLALFCCPSAPKSVSCW